MRIAFPVSVQELEDLQNPVDASLASLARVRVRSIGNHVDSLLHILETLVFCL